MENSDVSILSYDDKDINLSNIVLSMPSSIQGGSYFTKIQYLKRPLYMQSPTCSSKQGIITVGKKTYIDLIISNEKDGEFISFLENLEKTCIDIIFEKRHIWFTDDLEKTDIEMAFASIIKSYKNGTSHLLKLNINNVNNTNNIKHGIGGVQNCFIFDENNNTLPLDHIKPEMQLITIIDFEGIKFTSKSFQFEMNARQILIINEKPVFNSCLIKPKKNVSEITENVVNEVATNEVANEVATNEVATNEVANEVATNEVAANSNLIVNNPKPITLEGLENVANDINENPEIVKDLEDVQDVQDVHVDKIVINENNQLIEIDLEIPPELDSKFEKIKLQDANDVYYKMYKEAKEKAKSAKKMAVEAYLAAEEIKFTYNLLDNESDSDSDSDSDGDSDDDDNDNHNGGNND